MTRETTATQTRYDAEMEVANQIMVKGIVVGVFQENCWVIGNRRSGEAICVDPGDQPDEILALARDMGVTIKYIANSHAHIDHVLGVRGVQAATGAKFLLHHQDLGLLQDGFGMSARRFGLDPSQQPPDPDSYLEDGDIVEVDGLQLKVITTPGHTPGSVSFYTEGFLFSGDTLFRGSIGRTDLPGGSLEEEMRSICDRLLVLPEETIVLPGHMDETTIEFEKKRNPFVLEWRMRQQEAAR
jgi:hydroxyacylglutathione hydrolase